MADGRRHTPGPTWKPVEDVELGVSFGGQQSASGIEPRYAASASAKLGEFRILGITEFDHHGADTLWWNVLVNYEVAGIARIGIHSRRFLGTGPQLEILIPGLPVKVYGTWAVFDPEAGNWRADKVLLGVNMNL